MNLRITRGQTIIRFEGSIPLAEIERLMMSAPDTVLINRASSGPQLEEDSLRVFAMIFQRYREQKAK